MGKAILIVVAMIGMAGITRGDSWTQLANFSGQWRSSAVGFSIGNKGYLGLGNYHANNQTTYLNDFWEYDPSTNSWTQMADYAGSSTESATGFSIVDKGFIVNNNDFWEYDPSTNTWIQKANFIGPARSAPIGFSIGNKGFVGFGESMSADGSSDFWEYNPISDSWTQKASQFNRRDQIGFSINSMGYVGLGKISYCGMVYDDLFEYSPDSNLWIPRANFVGQRRYAIGFSIGNKGYAGAGTDETNWFKDFWEYNPTNNQWNQKSDLPYNNLHTMGIGFGILDRGYVYIPDSSNAFWEYTPDAATGINEIAQTNMPTSLFPNPFTDKTTFTIAGNPQNTMLNIFNIQGQKVKSFYVGNAKEYVMNRDDLSEGIYFYELIDSNSKPLVTGKIVVE